MAREIPLTQGQVAIVDDEDYYVLSRWAWYAKWDPDTCSFYAARNGVVEGRRTKIRMHRQIFGLNPHDTWKVDHRISGNTLDNRRSNLRLASAMQNTQNARRRKDNTTGYKGVHFNSRWKKYRARIQSKGKRILLGDCDTAEEAYLLYVTAARRLHGEFACTERK